MGVLRLLSGRCRLSTCPEHSAVPKLRLDRVCHWGGEARALSVWDRPQKINRFGFGELFAEKTGDKTAAADFAAGFHSAQHDQQIAPGGCEGFAREQITENDSPPVQIQPRDSFSAFLLGRTSGGYFQ